MKNSARLLSILALAGGSVAVAAPRESLTLTNVPSITRQGSPDNFVTTLNATGSDGGGSYVASAINFSGSLGNFRGVSWQREAMVRVSPPSGTPFVIAAGSLGSATAATFTNHMTVPVSAVTTAGTWTFEFFDDFDDVSTPGVAASEATLGAYDSLWSTVTIALDDAAPAAPVVGSGPSVTFTNVDSDGVTGAPAQTRTWNNTTSISTPAPGLRIRGRVVTRTTNDANVVLNQPGNARIRITPPGGTPINPWTADLALSSMGTVSQTIDLSTAGSVVGNWTFDFFEGADLAAGVDNQWVDISFELVDISVPPPSAVDLGTFSGVGSTETVATSTWTMSAANEVKWFRFAIPADAVAGSTNYVDIDTDDTNPGAAALTGNVQDTHLGIYRASGTFMLSDDDDGIDQRSALSFGDNVNIRPANTPTAPNLVGAARNGRDGALVAGTYYVSVTTFNPTYANNFAVTPAVGRTDVGSRTVAVRTNFTLAPSCVCCNLSNVAGPNQSTTPDDVLTADDIIVFLGWFFANDGRANVAGANQSTIPDNVLTADDIIVFLGRYFQGC